MKRIILITILLLIHCGFLKAQGKYISINSANYTPFYGSCNVTVRVPQNAPWYVFSDRENNPVYSVASGNTISSKVGLGKAFLVIDSSVDMLQVIDADQIVIDQIQGGWQYKSGVKGNNVTQGWISQDKLLLNQKCLKVCQVGIPSAPSGLFNLQGLYIYNVASTNTNYKYFTNVPGSYANEVGKTELNVSDRFGYIFKVMNIGGVDWYLIGQMDEIRIGDGRIILKGWKPRDQVELWKHRLALEYNWEGAVSRQNSSTRLSILKSPQPSTISRSAYLASQFVDKEYNYIQGTPSKDYYFTRELGTGFRNVILEENAANYKLGVLKNSCNVDPDIVNPARAMANDIIKELLNPKVIFVLDGTQSLSSQQTNIINTIIATDSRIKASNIGKAINYEYGVSIYRDEKYKYPFEFRPNFTSNVSEITTWLSANLGRIEGTDCDQPEALFFGLNQSMSRFEGLKSFFNPSFYVLIGDAGSHNPDMDNITAETIKSKLKANVSDLVAIQFEHSIDKKNCGKPDNGTSFDLFQSQFRDILSIFGNSGKENINGGTKEMYDGRPGSFLAYPPRGTSFGTNDLSSVLQDALLNYNNTIQEKLIHLALMLRSNNSANSDAQRELREFVNNFLKNNNLSASNIDQIMDWVIRFLENAANNIITSKNANTSAGTVHNIQIASNCINFFNPGYTCLNYSFLTDPPFKHVIYMNSNNLDKILDFSRRISTLTGAKPSVQIQQTWQYMLITALGVFQNQSQVNALTISEATSILTGFKGNNAYDNIHIGDITQKAIFTDDLLFKYVFEWGITYGYLQSVKNGTWELGVKNLKTLIPVINAIQSKKHKPNITPTQLSALSEKLIRKDSRTLANYYKGYPYEEMDPLYKLKAYWIEADFFSTEGNNFVNLLP